MTSSGSRESEPGLTRNEDQVSEMNASLPSLMEELAALIKSNEKGRKNPNPGKKKKRKMRISLKGKPPEIKEG
ncbi:hypothetical protein DPMN_052695 [Dreissena polymorpha]|uniref:Uncharacterized protein n=1 Tax=Dreissena polymorpha TaxID=45954 RepID=A0A9D4CK49_DREPO|nr:hypothetical protein DPMN_052695 [Dreissena polymorpha]